MTHTKMKTKLLLLFIGILAFAGLILYSSILIETKENTELECLSSSILFKFIEKNYDDTVLVSVQKYNDTYYLRYNGTPTSVDGLSRINNTNNNTDWTKYAKLTNKSGCYYYYNGTLIKGESK